MYMLFLDTNVLLDDVEYFENERFAISGKTLEELENIKNSRNKSEDIKASARKVQRWLADHHGEYEVVVETNEVYDLCVEKNVDCYNPDHIICATAALLAEKEDVHFVTHDLSCRNIAEQIFGLDVEWFEDKEKVHYTGFMEAIMSDDEMAFFYEHQNDNTYNLLVNQYLIIKNINGDIVDSYRWDGSNHQTIYKKPVKSIYFDKLKPKDIYQSFAMDSIINNTLTAISGKAGSGKSLISLATIMSLVENGKYDRFVTLFNPIKARGTADLGYYAGDFLSKAMLNSVGNILTTKFGDRYAIDILLSQNKLKLVSMADCRGMEIMDNEILYIPEAENTTVDMMKLCLSRVSSGAKVIIEGDPESQVDSYQYEGKNNGLMRVIEKFKDKKEFGYIQLQNVWRSKIAELCELL